MKVGIGRIVHVSASGIHPQGSNEPMAGVITGLRGGGVSDTRNGDAYVDITVFPPGLVPVPLPNVCLSEYPRAGLSAFPPQHVGP